MYDVLIANGGSPVVALNRAVAVGEHEGPGAALTLLDELAETGDLDRYHYFHSARAEMLRRLDRPDEASAAFEQALGVCDNAEAQDWIRRRIEQTAVSK